MPSPSDMIHALVLTKEAEAAVQAVPRKFNAALNRQFKAIGGEFGREFTTARLNKAGVNIHRKAAVKKQGGLVFLPRKMRLAGFKAVITGRDGLDGKKLSIRTSNPVMLAHELGATILPGGKGRRKWLAIPFSKQPKGVSPEERREAFVIRSKSGLPILVTRSRGTGKKEKLRGLAFLAKSVTMKPRLKYLATWDGYVPKALARLDKAAEDTLKRLEREESAA